MDLFPNFVAGWGGGILGLLVGHPMDTIKTKQQMSLTRPLTTREAIRIIIKEDGLKGLYKGMLFPLLCSGTLNSAFFGIYAICLSSLQSSRGHSPTYVLPTNSGYYYDNFIAGCAGGVAQALISCPSELIKIRMQIGKGIFKNNINSNKMIQIKKPSTYYTAKDVYKKYGIHGFFIGGAPTFYRDIIANGFYIVTYQYFRYNLHGQLDLNPRTFEILVAGGIAGICSWLPVIPFDTLKSRIQADDFKNRKYKGMMDCGIHLYRKEGLHGFFKGSAMITLRSIPVNAAIFYGYHSILWVLVPNAHY
ncbi:solute carrier family 25 member 45-like [Belonocnema kinseyi]|uniref:solute carrier family 25 member 45-like n=1 Tax=Belonocnema kinseyi TaxID=2817044 RepID=UPI00143DD1FC|nr:solute carrier family 25 member 45-like [Belonocnema kinseyi]